MQGRATILDKYDFWGQVYRGITMIIIENITTLTYDSIQNS